MKIQNFERIASLKANGRVNVKKYRSTETGLTVVIADVPGPLVKGFFTLATEAHDDDGLPHTLEHLIFMGSEDYPFKGVLDLLANRYLASGTNAWTDTDHTCYTVTTAGSEGFLNLMPVYVEHILYPTLTDAAFITEVHHVTGEGSDGGIVYCEMQGTENTGESRVYLEMLRGSYPGHCGYKSETGGLMKNLRESTTNAKVRQYHKDFYRPENLTLIIAGQIEDKDVFDALKVIEDKIIRKGPRHPFVRPWERPVPPLTKSVDMVVPFASDEEDNGMVYVAWRGPSCVEEVYKMHACSLLLRYLTQTSISPLQLEFVEISDPVASSVSYSLLENSISLLLIMLENVPVEKLSEVKPRLEAKLREIGSGTEKLDMERLRAVINRQKLETLLNLETLPHSSIAYLLIADALYGSTDEHLEQRMNPLRDLEKMETETEAFWLGLLNQYLISAPSVTVRGKPSIAERSRLAQEEEMRVSEQVEKLGVEGLKKKEEELKGATIVHDTPPPSSMLTACPVPDPSRITHHEIQIFSSSGNQPNGFNLTSLPVSTDLHVAETNFAYLMILMDTSDVPSDLRMYLPLYLNSLLESPILRDGKVVPYQTVVGDLEKDTISTATSLGIHDSSNFSCGPYCQTANLTIQVEPSKYEKGVGWLHDILFGLQFNADRLSIIAAKMINEVAEFRRNGRKVCGDLLTELNFTRDNNLAISNMVRQQQFLSNIGKVLCEGKDSNRILTDLETLKSILTKPSNMSIRIAINLKTIGDTVPDLEGPWKSFLPDCATACQKKLKVTPEFTFLRPDPLEKRACVLGLGSVESAFLCQSVPSINDYCHPDLPALMVFIQYMTQLEGPMWKLIRGCGLSYGYHMLPRANEGLLQFSLAKSTNVLEAYKKAKTIVDSLVESGAFDPILLDSAKSSKIFEIIEGEGTVSNAIIRSIFTYFKKVPADYSRDLVRKVAAVASTDLKRVGEKYVSPLFDATQAKTSIVCHPSKVEEISSNLKELGFEVKAVKTLNEVFL